MLEDFLNKLAATRGQAKAAAAANVDAGQFCKFLSNTGALKLRDIEALLSLGNAVIVDQSYIGGLENALLTAADMAKRYKTQSDDK
jgi:hypothetical protein